MSKTIVFIPPQQPDPGRLAETVMDAARAVFVSLGTPAEITFAEFLVGLSEYGLDALIVLTVARLSNLHPRLDLDPTDVRAILLKGVN